jgi:hypothetical protein
MCQGRRGSGISSLGNEAELEAKTSQTPDAKAESSTTGNHSDSSVAGSRPNTPGIVTRTARRADQVVDSTAWLQPEFPPAVVDGKFIRPKGNAPIEGYVWCSKKGELLLDKILLPRQAILNFPLCFSTFFPLCIPDSF